MSNRLSIWALRAGWAGLPLVAGPALSAALHHHTGVRSAASVALWAAWGGSLVATMVPHPISLTTVRIVAPAVVGAALAAAVEGHASTTWSAIGLAWATAVALLAFLPGTAMVFVNGPAYANERRYPLAVPGPLLLGPIELAWAATVGLPAATIGLAALHRWGWAATTAALGTVAVAILGRSLHGLSRRWVVFVPAGLVLHDPLSLTDPVLFERKVIERLGPARADTDSLDLTQRAAGLALELVLRDKVPMVRVRPGRRKPDAGASARLLFTPTRPGAVLRDAASRRIAVSLPEP